MIGITTNTTTRNTNSVIVHMIVANNPIKTRIKTSIMNSLIWYAQ